MLVDKNLNIQNISLDEIHPSWINALPNGQLIQKLIQLSNSNTQLIKYLKQFIALKDLNKPSGVVKHLHSYDSSILTNIILKAGAVQLSKRISRIISRQEVKMVQDMIGEKLYKFALYEAPLAYPDLLEIEKKELIINTNELQSNMISAGYRSFKIALEKVPNNCCYKLPKKWNDFYETESYNMDIAKLGNKERLLHMDLILSLAEKNLH